MYLHVVMSTVVQLIEAYNKEESSETSLWTEYRSVK